MVKCTRIIARPTNINYLGGEEMSMSASLNSSKSSMLDPLHTHNELDLVGEESNGGEKFNG
jgi:hypothetical protein